MQPTAEEVRLQLDRLLASDAFAQAERLSRFLRFVVERALAGEADQLKEYVVGLAVFDRDEQYDPRVDSIVRVEAGRLRAKVEAYYHGEGRHDAVVISIPRGSYAPAFEHRRSEAPPSVSPDDAGRLFVRRRSGWRLGLGAAAAIVALLAVAAWRAGLWATGGQAAAPVTVAVLPFAHYSTDESGRLLAARVTDGVTSELARLGTVGVVSRTSALQFTEGRRSLREVARALNADLVMEASLFADRDRVRVEVRLVDGELDRKVWVRGFEGSTTDLRALERRVAAAAAAAAVSRRSAER